MFEIGERKWMSQDNERGRSMNCGFELRRRKNRAGMTERRP